MDQHNNNNGKDTGKTPEQKVTPSSADIKNEGVIHDTPSATERVKPRSGDGLANEGTNVSYEEQR